MEKEWDINTEAKRYEEKLNQASTTARQNEIPEFLDRLHSEIIKNRELQGMLDDKLQPIMTSPEVEPDSAVTPCMTEMGGRLNNMIEYLSATNRYLNFLWNRIQL